MFKLKAGWTKRKVMNRIKKYNDNTRSLASATRCAYKSFNGNRCAIGCFIPDNHESFDSSQAVELLLTYFPDLEKSMPFDNIQALCQFQAIHDNSEDGEVYKNIKKFLDKEVV